jgi:hypothetical protein
MLQGRNTIYWGAAAYGDVYEIGQLNMPYLKATWDTFEAHTAKKVGIVHFSNPWLTWDGYGTAASKCQERGAIPFITIGNGSPALSAIVAGEHDTEIDVWATKAAEFGHPLFVRPWWEMNGTWYAWGQSASYIAAWQRLYNRVNAIAHNVSLVWCPSIIGPSAPDPTTWWPGDAYVDWIGMDGYNWGTNTLQPDSWKTASTVFTATYNILTALSAKPIIICETASTESGGTKSTWITELLSEAGLKTLFPHVRAFLWFNDNIIKGEGRMDWQIESSTNAQKAFHDGIASAYYRLPEAASFPSGAKVPIP